MPTDYTADPSQTRAPAPLPAPESQPIVRLPVDGEQANVASIDQPLKMLTDFVGWLMKPRAIPAAWAAAIRRHRTSQGHTRFTVDHLGFPAGRIIDWREWWPSVQVLDGATADTALTNLPGWGAQSVANNDDTALRFENPGVNGGDNAFRHARFTADATSGSWFALYRQPSCRLTSNNHVAFEWEAKVTAALTNCEVGLGFGYVPPAGVGQRYIRFYAASDHANWRCRTHDGTSQTSVTTSVAVDVTAPHAFRIEWHGSGVADDSVQSVRFYIDGVLVATIATTLPVAEDSYGPFFFLKNIGGGAASSALILGPAHFMASLYAADLY